MQQYAAVVQYRFSLQPNSPQPRRRPLRPSKPSELQASFRNGRLWTGELSTTHCSLTCPLHSTPLHCNTALTDAAYTQARYWQPTPLIDTATSLSHYLFVCLTRPPSVSPCLPATSLHCLCVCSHVRQQYQRALLVTCPPASRSDPTPKATNQPLTLKHPRTHHATLCCVCVGGGNQSINIFGGSDEPVEQPRRTGRRQQQDITPSIGSQPAAVVQPKPSVTSHTSSIGSAFNDAAPAPASAATPQQTVAAINAPFGQDTHEQPAAGIQPAPAAGARVNNIWGSDDDQPQRSSTRILRGPGGSSSGVAGALGGGDETKPEVQPKRIGGYRANQTSANSPFSSEPEPQRSSTRIHHPPGSGGNGNILSCKRTEHCTPPHSAQCARCMHSHVYSLLISFRLSSTLQGDTKPMKCDRRLSGDEREETWLGVLIRWRAI